MFKTNKQLYEALVIKHPELKKKYKVTLAKRHVTVVKKNAACCQMYIPGSADGVYMMRAKRSKNGGYGRYGFSQHFPSMGKLVTAIKGFLSKAPIVEVSAIMKPKHSKNKLKVLKTFKAHQPVLFKTNEVVDAKVYIYGKGTDIHSPETDELTIKADLWIASGDCTYRDVTRPKWYCNGSIEIVHRVVIETNGKGKFIKAYRVPTKSQRVIPVIICNPEFIEDAIHDAFFGKE